MSGTGNGWAWWNPTESEKSGVRKSGIRNICGPGVGPEMGGLEKKAEPEELAGLAESRLRGVFPLWECFYCIHRTQLDRPDWPQSNH